MVLVNAYSHMYALRSHCIVAVVVDGCSSCVASADGYKILAHLPGPLTTASIWLSILSAETSGNLVLLLSALDTVGSIRLIRYC